MSVADITPPRHVLSKSTFLRGCQCPKSLYLNRFHKELRDRTSAEQQAIIDRGTAIGIVARELLFPNGADASPGDTYNFAQSVIYTQQLLQRNQQIIYEAAFQHDRVLVLLDILVNRMGVWHAYEVKSTGRITDTHLMDASLQYFVITQSGLPIDDISIIYPDKSKVVGGPMGRIQDFITTNITAEVLDRQDFVKEKINDFLYILSAKQMPNTKTGDHCLKPYRCDFFSYCHGNQKPLPLFSKA